MKGRGSLTFFSRQNKKATRMIERGGENGVGKIGQGNENKGKAETVKAGRNDRKVETGENEK